jgi:anaerobic C4-dicarboxylate transporter
LFFLRAAVQPGRHRDVDAGRPSRHLAVSAGGHVPGGQRCLFLPTYGTVLAAVSFDQTGTTRIGKYLLNHSFMLPGLVTTISATLLALLFSTIAAP